MKSVETMPNLHGLEARQEHGGHSGNSKDKMNALEDAYNKLRSKTPSVSGTRRVTKIDIIRSASLHTAALEEQLKEARGTLGPPGWPGRSAIGPASHPDASLEPAWRNQWRTVDADRRKPARSWVEMAGNHRMAGQSLERPLASTAHIPEYLGSPSHQGRVGHRGR